MDLLTFLLQLMRGSPFWVAQLPLNCVLFSCVFPVLGGRSSADDHCIMMIDEKTGSLVQTLFIQGCPGSFSFPSIVHWIQPISISCPLYSKVEKRAKYY